VFPLPPAHTDYVESVSLPIRVHYSGPSQLTMADEVLVAAENAWHEQVDVVGYPAPRTDGDEGPVVDGLWFYLANLGGAGGYTEPLADIDTTADCDCSSRVVLDQANPSQGLPSIVAHEFNHTTQMAIDCTEAMSAFENFATAVMIHYYPDDPHPLGFIEVFQNYPEWPVDYWTQNPFGRPPQSYQYGAALFPLYLEARFGAGDLTLLRDIWASFAQAGTVTVSMSQVSCSAGNDPDWFQGLETVLGTLGTNLDTVFDEFSYWRAITGAQDDGEHYPHGDRFATADTVPMSLDSLPETLEYDLHEYGSAHVLLADAADAAPFTLSVTVEEGATFGVSLLLWKAGEPVERQEGTFTDGEAVFDITTLDDVTRAVLVVSQHSDGNYDPDLMDYSTVRSFTVSAWREGDTPDASVIPDGSPDAAPGVDADVDPQASGGDSGCSCRLAGAQPATPPVLLVLVVALLAGSVVGRRRPGRRTCR